ncbi:MAG: Putative transcriptional regulator [Methanomicrobiales archaeon 53_19]|nr:MAG: Putative transcriptional regulator [Methanomicrobiales archaeon 53_19]
MIAACRRDGLPEPQFREAGSDFVVAFTGSVFTILLEHPDLLNERQRGVIEYLKTHPYRQRIMEPPTDAPRDLSTLAEMGIIAVKREGRLRRYVLNPSFRSLRTEPGLREMCKICNSWTKPSEIREPTPDPVSSIRTIADS